MGVSTHVLDAAAGVPAAGLELSLGRRDGETWHELARRVTDADGRVADLAGPLAAGEYRITFQTGAYLGGRTFYPEVTVVFAVTDPAAHYHVPLLLSPYAYSTYRGS